MSAMMSFFVAESNYNFDPCSLAWARPTEAKCNTPAGTAFCAVGRFWPQMCQSPIDSGLLR
jgi:hypothetical protein